MLKESLLLASFVFSQFVPAQIVRLPAGSLYTRTTAYSRQFSDAFSFSANQGALAEVGSFSAGVYSERRFLLNALSLYSAAVVLPTTSGNFGFKGDYFGEVSYNESAISLAYGRSVSSKLAVGLQFNYLAIKAAGYGAASAVNFDAGAIVHVTPQFNAGVHVYNPVQKGWGKNKDEFFPATYSVGLGYDASPQVFVGAEVDKTDHQPIGVNAGLHYKLAEQFIARMGIRSASVCYLGLGIRKNRLRIDVTASLHPYLGLTPGLLLLFLPTE
ncbi:MAG TPA: hypothetical protein VFL47_15865 [Flavisolibacter sp.]|nr:hypothetical protein [Flavisolibacter sp.]